MILIVIYTERLDEVRDFYAELGLTFTKEQHGGGPVHYATTIDTTVIELYPAGDRPPTGRLRLGLTIPAGASRKPLPVGEHVLSDPDGRAVAITVTEDHPMT
ncbi:VOC family protein [Microbispora sp. NPDC049125]|uniref:VOC family protein n=1 Tax=Microbispora sp. NPDC049125 TaxID=3154929 RepID=UPI0034676A93